MSKKEKIVFQRSDELEAIDSELAAAMDNLDETNQRIVDLLGSLDLPAPPTDLERAAEVEEAEVVAEPAKAEAGTDSETVPEGHG